MALVDAHGNPIAAQPLPVPVPQAAAGQLIDVNQLRTTCGNPKAEFPLFYGNSVFDSIDVL